MGRREKERLELTCALVDGTRAVGRGRTDSRQHRAPWYGGAASTAGVVRPPREPDGRVDGHRPGRGLRLGS